MAPELWTSCAELCVQHIAIAKISVFIASLLAGHPIRDRSMSRFFYFWPGGIVRPKQQLAQYSLIDSSQLSTGAPSSGTSFYGACRGDAYSKTAGPEGHLRLRRFPARPGEGGGRAARRPQRAYRH